jgi:ribonuclease HII
LEDWSVIVGVDESGTGAWAGPYTVTAYASLVRDAAVIRKKGGYDSKKMTDLRRRQAVEDLYEAGLFGCTELVSVQRINEHRRDAWRFAVRRAIAHTVNAIRTSAFADSPLDIVVDGNECLITARRVRAELGVEIRFQVKADATIPGVGAASVIAKTERNNAMIALHELYPQYGWNSNYGYGTAAHASAIAEHGRTPEHRDLRVEVLGWKKEEI